VYHASCDYYNVGVFADVEIIVNKVDQPHFRQHNGDVDAFSLCSGLYAYVDPRFVLFGSDLDIGGGPPINTAAVHSDIKCAAGSPLEVCDLFQQTLLNDVHLAPLFFQYTAVILKQFGEYLILFAGIDHFSRYQKDDLIRNFQYPFLMGDDNDRRGHILLHSFENADQAVEAPQIDARLRFVKNGERRIFRDKHSKLYSLQFAA
jgi:hypothetical protein